MSLPDFSARSARREIIDDHTLSPDEHQRVARDLHAINRSLGGYRLTFDGILRLLPATVREISVLDVGAGYGDGAKALIELGLPRGLEVRVVALDPSTAGLRLAQSTVGHRERLAFVCGDGADLPFAERSFDVAICSLVLHHCSDPIALRLIRSMYRVSRWGIVVNDLHRHPLAWLGILAWTRLYDACHTVRHDGPLSVLRGFSRDDLFSLARSANLPVEVRWGWAFRWQMVARRSRA